MVRCHHPLIVASVVAVAAFSLLAAGCGGAGSAGVASVASSTTAGTSTAQNGAGAEVGASPSLAARSHGFRHPSTPTAPETRRSSRS
jgi:hypothetical protein